ncbi:uncharacterized protein LOC117653130 isoform X2 [Thrips palmi]|nr:uncharacterized protein LOC117653130 isoform X2 [Thrips palmi]
MCLLTFCLVTLPFLNFVKLQDYFKISPPNKDGWISPDVAFAPTRPMKSERNDVSVEDIDECHKNVDNWVEKYSECEKALQTLEFDRRGEKGEANRKELSVSKPSEQFLQEKNGAKAYLQRFIHLLLEASNLNNIEVQPKNWARLEFSIPSDHLHTLRRFANEGDVKSIPLRKLDEILGSILVKPLFSLPELNYGDIFNKLPGLHIGSFFISISLPFIGFLSVLYITKNIRKSLILLILFAFVTSFFTTAYQMFEEAQIKQYEEMKKYPDMPQDCKGSFSWTVWFSGRGECSKFLKAHHMDPHLGITPFKVFAKIIGETMADTMKYFGSGTFAFFESFQDMSLINRIWVSSLASVLLYGCIVLLSLVITGGTGRLPFFMGSFSFHNPAQRQPALSPHFEAHASVPPQNAEALTTGNITVNITSQMPANVNEILASISRGVIPSNQHNLASPSTAAFQDLLGGGDNVQSNISHQSHLNRPHASFVSKKTQKQFSQLSSKYKSGIKSSKLILKRARNLSL